MALSTILPNRASAQTIQSNFLIVASDGQIQIQQINNGTYWTECLSCSSPLIAWCSVTCTINAVVDRIAKTGLEDASTIQVVRYTDGSFAAFDRLGQNMSGFLPVTLTFDWGSLSSGEAALLNALSAG